MKNLGWSSDVNNYWTFVQLISTDWFKGNLGNKNADAKIFMPLLFGWKYNFLTETAQYRLTNIHKHDEYLKLTLQIKQWLSPSRYEILDFLTIYLLTSLSASSPLPPSFPQTFLSRAAVCRDSELYGKQLLCRQEESQYTLPVHCIGRHMDWVKVAHIHSYSRSDGPRFPFNKHRPGPTTYCKLQPSKSRKRMKAFHAQIGTHTLALSHNYAAWDMRRSVADRGKCRTQKKQKRIFLAFPP